jgi:hypothetical protein
MNYRSMRADEMALDAGQFPSFTDGAAERRNVIGSRAHEHQ